MKTLEWLSWLSPIRWLEFIPAFDWADVLPDIDWSGIINLQGIKDAWASVSGWLEDASANLWDILPDMPDLKFWGDDEIEDPKTLLAAAAAAE